MNVARLLRVSLNTGDLDAAIAFYAGALGFQPGTPREDPALARLLGAERTTAVRLRRGRQELELAASWPLGAPIPVAADSRDLPFQHCALVTSDIPASWARLAGTAARPISHDGPVELPGGIVAFKFRDPDGHPLEFIAFPDPDPATEGGIDHSAISVASAARSAAWYEARLGLQLGHCQVNEGAAQDRLDGLAGAVADVWALHPPDPAPHVELLGYHPPGRVARSPRPTDLASSRLVFASDAECDALMHDPDGYAIQLATS